MSPERDAHASWIRLLVSVAIDWRLILAVVLLLIVLSMR